MSREIAAQLARRFIQNRDVKAIQFSNGDYVPDFRMKDTQPEFGGSPETSRHGLGFTMEHLLAHLEGRETYGHYLLDKDGMARMFAFDIDLEVEGTYVVQPGPFQVDYNITNQQFDEQVKVYGPVNPRELWLDRTQTQARDWYKQQMMRLVHRFAGAISAAGIEGAAAYSGSKGVHVYGFMPESKPLPADEVRFVAETIMKGMDDFELVKGEHFFGHKSIDPVQGFKNFSIEIFPKQRETKKGGLGNLMRLPLGRNQKTSDPTFFLDLKAPVAQMRPHPNPTALLESGDPYA